MSNGWDLVDRVRELSQKNMSESGGGLIDTGRAGVNASDVVVEFCADTKCDCEKYGGRFVELMEGI